MRRQPGKGSKEFGTRAEIKNVNSFSALQRAIEYEIDRQIEIVEEGGQVVQETRLWDDNLKETRSMRGKEDAHDKNGGNEEKSAHGGRPLL